MDYKRKTNFSFVCGPKWRSKLVSERGLLYITLDNWEEFFLEKCAFSDNRCFLLAKLKLSSETIIFAADSLNIHDKIEVN